MAASRIDDLRRRVEADPASIAFAQLAEEYRRAGQSEEAVRVCREGLERHPAYLSARVTLGRALLDMGDFRAAREELEFVAREAPENLSAVRGLAEISHREGSLGAALDYYKRALALARHDPELEEIVEQLSRQVGAAASPSGGLSFEEAHQELLTAAERVPLVESSAKAFPMRAESQGMTAPFDFDKLVAALGSPAGPPAAPPPPAARQDVAPIHSATTPTVQGPLHDPFASLEAELRARDDAPTPASGTSLPTADTVAASAAEPTDLPDTAVADTTSHSGAPLDADLRARAAFVEPSAALPVPRVDPATREGDRPSEPAELLSQNAVHEAADPRGRLGPPERHAPDHTTVEPVLPSALDHVTPPPALVGVAAEADDDVLGDLEGWLNTLQARAGR